jgi:hypothetical protein
MEHLHNTSPQEPEDKNVETLLTNSRNKRFRLQLLVAEDLDLPRLRLSSLASTRLRIAVAAERLQASSECDVLINTNTKITDPTVVIVGKVGSQNSSMRSLTWLNLLTNWKAQGAKIILDYTDNHLGFESPMRSFYEKAVLIADKIVVPTESMADLLSGKLCEKIVKIPDALEYTPVPPRRDYSSRGIWFGHASNIEYLITYLHKSEPLCGIKELIVCSDLYGIRYFFRSVYGIRTPNIIPVIWSVENLRTAMLASDFSVLPVGVRDPKKKGASENRLITSLCLGLPTFTEALPSYTKYSDYYEDLSILGKQNLESQVKDLHLKVHQAQSELLPAFTSSSCGQRWEFLVFQLLKGGAASHAS